MRLAQPARLLFLPLLLSVAACGDLAVLIAEPTKGASPAPGASASPSATTGGATAAPTGGAPSGVGAVSDFTFLDRTSDRISTWTADKPDGSKELHFRVVVAVPAGDAITRVSLYTVDKDGKRCCGQIWDSDAAGHWILGVYNGNTPVYEQKTAKLAGLSGTFTWDLYATDSGYATSGQGYEWEAGLASGGTLTKQTRIP